MFFFYTTDQRGGFLGYISAVDKAAAIRLWNSRYQARAYGAVETCDPSIDFGGN